MNQIALLGDSIFDNKTYVVGPDVVEQLGAVLPPGWGTTLEAIDGAVVRHVPDQVHRLPKETTHVVVSAGGNDGLGCLPLLGERSTSVFETLDRFADIKAGFRRDYRQLLDAVTDTGLPAAVCTIYEPRFEQPQIQRAALTALSFFNDVIVYEATARRLPVIDLRRICTEDEDFANEIEPGIPGGAKIAAVIAQWALTTDPTDGAHVLP